MTLFRSLVIGILGALLLLHIQHLFQHAHHEHAHLHQAAHSHAASHRAGGLEATTWRRTRPTTTPRAPAARATPITADTVLVDIERSSVQRLAAGQDLLAQARMVPTLHQGRVQGLRFYAVRPDSLFAALGVHNGDTMLSINGGSMSRLDCAPPELFADIFSDPPGFLDIQLVRDGQPMRMVVLVHEQG